MNLDQREGLNYIIGWVILGAATVLGGLGVYGFYRLVVYIYTNIHWGL